MDFRRITSILSCSNLEEGFTNRILVVLMDLSKIDLFSHRFYLNLYMYEIISTSTVLYTIVRTTRKYGFTHTLHIVHLYVGPVSGHSSIITPILQWNILDSLSNTDNVIIPEFRILLFTRLNTLV